MHDETLINRLRGLSIQHTVDVDSLQPRRGLLQSNVVPDGQGRADKKENNNLLQISRTKR
jgi:hypothetical protein